MKIRVQACLSLIDPNFHWKASDLFTTKLTNVYSFLFLLIRELSLWTAIFTGNFCTEQHNCDSDFCTQMHFLISTSSQTPSSCISTVHIPHTIMLFQFRKVPLPHWKHNKFWDSQSYIMTLYLLSPNILFYLYSFFVS